MVTRRDQASHWISVRPNERGGNDERRCPGTGKEKGLMMKRHKPEGEENDKEMGAHTPGTPPELWEQATFSDEEVEDTQRNVGMSKEDEEAIIQAGTDGGERRS